jgi:DNA invertase Pin-like site-specific DNA recombinase
LGAPFARKLLFNVLAMVAEFEGDLIRARTREGMRIAKAKGRLKGEEIKLSPKQEAHLVELHAAGEHTSGPIHRVPRAGAVPPEGRRASGPLMCPLAQLR